MKFKALQRWSIKSKVTLFTLFIFMISIWTLALYASRMLHQDMEQVSSEQQFSTVSLMAAEINEQLTARLESLGKIAEEITPAMIADPASLQTLLEHRPLLPILFNGGIFATGKDGTAIADLPRSAGRVGTNYLDRTSISVPINEGTSIIGRPAMGKKLGAPLFSISVPVRDRRGTVIGVLVGTINLSKPSFLDKITNHHYGKTGGYLLVAPQYRLIVTATDKSRIMEELPLSGISPLIQRFIGGYEGSGVTINPHGMEVLVSVKRIPVAGWYVAAALPTTEAFAPIHAMLHKLLLATVLLTLIACGLTWWLLRRQLSPMFAAVTAINVMTGADRPPTPLPIVSHDEIGQLVGGFNRLLSILVQREEKLVQLEERHLVLNQQLRAHGDHVLAVQEQERLAISRDIHDDVGQSLTALRFDLEWIERGIPAAKSGLCERIGEMRTTIDQINAKVQRIAADLRPPLLDNQGLSAAIEWHVGEFGKRSGLECFVLLNENTDPHDERTATAVMRIVQESLTNIARHAKATEVSISLCRRDGSMILEISDNGCGIRAEQISAQNAYGLMGMHERARICNGRLEITGTPGSGTIVYLEIPLDGGEATA